jgi:hypothetical protein
LRKNTKLALFHEGANGLEDAPELARNTDFLALAESSAPGARDGRLGLREVWPAASRRGDGRVELTGDFRRKLRPMDAAGGKECLAKLTHELRGGSPGDIAQ